MPAGPARAVRAYETEVESLRCYLGWHRWRAFRTDDGERYAACAQCGGHLDGIVVADHAAVSELAISDVAERLDVRSERALGLPSESRERVERDLASRG
jgi:hypothetical protein